MHQSPASSAHLGKKSLYSTTGVHIGVGNWKLLDWKDKVEWRKWREKKPWKWANTRMISSVQFPKDSPKFKNKATIPELED